MPCHAHRLPPTSLSIITQRTFQLAVQIGPGKFRDDTLDVREGTEEDFGCVDGLSTMIAVISSSCDERYLSLLLSFLIISRLLPPFSTVHRTKEAVMEAAAKEGYNFSKCVLFRKGKKLRNRGGPGPDPMPAKNSCSIL